MGNKAGKVNLVTSIPQTAHIWDEWGGNNCTVESEGKGWQGVIQSAVDFSRSFHSQQDSGFREDWATTIFKYLYQKPGTLRWVLRLTKEPGWLGFLAKRKSVWTQVNKRWQAGTPAGFLHCGGNTHLHWLAPGLEWILPREKSIYFLWKKHGHQRLFAAN